MAEKGISGSFADAAGALSRRIPPDRIKDRLEWWMKNGSDFGATRQSILGVLVERQQRADPDILVSQIIEEGGSLTNTPVFASLITQVAPEKSAGTMVGILQALAANKIFGSEDLFSELRKLAAKCPLHDAGPIVGSIMTQMERSASERQQAQWVRLILALPVRLNEEQISRIFNTTLSQFDKSSWSGTAIQLVIDQLSEGQAERAFHAGLTKFHERNQLLTTLIPRLHWSDAHNFAERIVELMAQSADRDRTATLAAVLSKLLGRVAAGDAVSITIDALRLPTTTGPAERILVDYLQNIARQEAKFEGKLWPAIEWVKKAYPKIDLNRPPRDGCR
jgi:hypothetical protein